MKSHAKSFGNPSTLKNSPIFNTKAIAYEIKNNFLSGKIFIKHLLPCKLFYKTFYKSSFLLAFPFEGIYLQNKVYQIFKNQVAEKVKLALDF